jgi:hypothetical protein
MKTRPSRSASASAVARGSVDDRGEPIGSPVEATWPRRAELGVVRRQRTFCPSRPLRGLAARSSRAVSKSMSRSANLGGCKRNSGHIEPHPRHWQAFIEASELRVQDSAALRIESSPANNKEVRWQSES